MVYSFQEWTECYFEQSVKRIHNPLKISNNRTCIWSLQSLGKLCSIYENISSALSVNWGFPGGSGGKESSCKARDRVQSLGQEGPLEKGMAIHSSVLAWRIPWTEDPGGLQSTGSQKSRIGLRDWKTNLVMCCWISTCLWLPRSMLFQLEELPIVFLLRLIFQRQIFVVSVYLVMSLFYFHLWKIHCQ